MSKSGLLKKIYADELGATAVEYGLILSLVVIAMIGSLSSFAEAAVSMWSNIEQKSADAINGS